MMYPVWMRKAGKRSRWHIEGHHWIRTGKAVCGARVENGREWRDVVDPIGRLRLQAPPNRERVCKHCLKWLEAT